METITLLLKEATSKGFTFLTTIKFKVEEEKALMAISDLPPLDLCPTWEKEIMVYDGDILQAYLRICASLINDTFSANDVSVDNQITLLQTIFSGKLLYLDGSDGIRLVSFIKSRTPVRSFTYMIGESYIWTLAVKHPDGIEAIFRIDTIHCDKIKENVEKQGARAFYWASLRKHHKEKVLPAYLAIITKMIAENFPQYSVSAIIDRFHFDLINQKLDGSDGIELISFSTRKLYSPKSGPGVFKFIVEEL